ncbi:MAG: hypothetical protein ACRDQZ_08570, partial [Mycobacteriales bacterium]
RWAMIGEEGVVVGYAERSSVSELNGQTLTRVHTVRHKIDRPGTRTAAVTTRHGHRVSVEQPTTVAEVAPPPDAAQIRVTRVGASTQCKSLNAASGRQSDTKTGCEVPGGKWVFA